MSFISPPVPEWPPGGSYGLPQSHSSSWTCAGPPKVPDDGSTYGTARRAESRDGRAREGMSAAEERGLSRGRRYGLSTTSFGHLATGHGAMRVAKWNVVAISLVYPLMSNAGSSARRGDAASMAARTAIAMA